MTKETKETLLIAATGFKDLASSIEKFAITIKTQAEHIDHKRLFSCGAELLGACDMLRDWAEGIKREVSK